MVYTVEINSKTIYNRIKKEEVPEIILAEKYNTSRGKL